MRKKLVQSFVVTVVFLVILNMYGVFSGSIESSQAVAQLSDSIVKYSWSQYIGEGGIGKVICGMWVVGMLAIWWPYIKGVKCAK